ELLHDRPDVNLDGALAHVEFVGDRLVRLAAPEGVRHCRLARSEVLLDPCLALDLLDNSVTEGKDARCRKEDAPGRCQPRRLDHHIRADAARDVPSRPVIDGGDHFREFFGFRKNDYRNIISLTDEVPDLLGNGGLGDTPPPDTQKDRDGRSAHVAGLPFTDRAVGGDGHGTVRRLDAPDEAFTLKLPPVYQHEQIVGLRCRGSVVGAADVTLKIQAAGGMASPDDIHPLSPFVNTPPPQNLLVRHRGDAQKTQVYQVILPPKQIIFASLNRRVALLQDVSCSLRWTEQSAPAIRSLSNATSGKSS